MEMHTRFDLIVTTRSAAEVESMLIVSADPRSLDLQTPNREDVLPRLPTGRISGQPFGRPRDSPSDSPTGRIFGQPFGRPPESRTVTRTGLREAHSNSPLGKKDEPTTSLRGCTHTVSSIQQGFVVQN
jgi:hypothetical protein